METKTQTLKKRIAFSWKLAVAAAFVLVVMAGGALWPAAGIAVSIVMLAAVISTLFSKRWFCAKACPRGIVLAGIGPAFSRYGTMPKFLYAPGTRMALCFLMLACTGAQVARLWPEFEALGFYFWMVCTVTSAIALVLAFLYRPRSWCAICPIGTLQGAIGRSPAAKEKD